MPLPSKPITRRAIVRSGAIVVGAAILPALRLTALAQDRPLAPIPKSPSRVTENIATDAGRSDVFLMNRIAPSSSDLYAANADGSGERKFLEAPSFDYNARFSADGRSIVFTSERS